MTVKLKYFTVITLRVRFMATREIHIPALMEGKNVIIPEIYLGKNVKYRTKNKKSLSAAQYQRFNPPTLAELRHAFFDKNDDNSFVSPEYRQSVLSKRGYGEWTSTFLRDGREAVERPEKVFFDEKHELWVVEGGKVIKVELPPDGWTLEYDIPTGFPSRTSSKRKDAEKVFGDDTSYFWKSDNGLRAVLRGFSLRGSGPFCVDAGCGPDLRPSFFGSRSCRRYEQDAKRLTTPSKLTTKGRPALYVMGQAEYETLTKKHQEIGELLSKIRVQK